MSTVMSDPKEEKKLSEEHRIHQETGGLKRIAQEALLGNNPLVQKGLRQERELRQRTKEECDQLLEKLQKSVSESEQDRKTLKEKTVVKLTTDLEVVKVLDAVLDPYKGSHLDKEGEKIARYPLKFNKMELAISGALKFLTTENFERLSTGQTPSGYSYTTEPDDVTILGENPLTLYGSSKGTFFKTAALTMYASSTNKVKLCDLDLNPGGPYLNWIDNSSMVHTASLPKGLKLKGRFNQFTYSFGQRFAYVHSGYSFGDGLRGEQTHYSKGKQFAPKDCSSWIEELCGVPQPMTTLDQLYYYRTKMKVGTIDPEWNRSSMVESMGNLFDVATVNVKDPQSDIQPGQILSTRPFDLTTDPKMEKSRGGVGHTGLVLGFNSQGAESQVVILAYSREMPKMEGFGIQRIPLFPPPVPKQHPITKNNVLTCSKVMIFSVKGKAAESASTLSSLGGGEQGLEGDLGDRRNRKIIL